MNPIDKNKTLKELKLEYFDMIKSKIFSDSLNEKEKEQANKDIKKIDKKLDVYFKDERTANSFSGAFSKLEQKVLSQSGNNELNQKQAVEIFNIVSKRLDSEDNILTNIQENNSEIIVGDFFDAGGMGSIYNGKIDFSKTEHTLEEYIDPLIQDYTEHHESGSNEDVKQAILQNLTNMGALKLNDVKKEMGSKNYPSLELAIKVIDDPTVRAKKEMVLAGKYHKHLITPFKADSTINKRTYLIMPLVKNAMSSDDIKTVLSYKSKLDVILGVIDGLSYLEKKGMVHRDIKPDNILVVKSEREIERNSLFGLIKKKSFIQGAYPYLIDFSLLKEKASILTSEGTVMCSPGYGSYEQVEDSSKVDITADIYSLTATLYTYLTGNNPNHNYKGNDSKLMILNTLNRINISDVRPDLKNVDFNTALVLAKGMRLKNNGNKYNERYHSLKEFNDDICDLRNNVKPRHAYKSAKKSPGSMDRFILDVFRTYEKPKSGCFGCIKGCALASILGLAVGWGAYKLPHIRDEINNAYKTIKPYLEEIKKIFLD